MKHGRLRWQTFVCATLQLPPGHSEDRAPKGDAGLLPALGMGSRAAFSAAPAPWPSASRRRSPGVLNVHLKESWALLVDCTVLEQLDILVRGVDPPPPLSARITEPGRREAGTHGGEVAGPQTGPSVTPRHFGGGCAGIAC